MSSNKNSILVIAALVCMVAGSGARAQELEISASPTPIGSGARAAGMADAFVAIADDATAASWNPAGLVQLERPEISAVGSFDVLSETFAANYHPEVDTTHGVRHVDLNYLSAAYPLPQFIPGHNITISLNFQRKYDFTRDFSIDYDTSRVTRTGSGRPINQFSTLDFQQSGSLNTISPAVAIEVTRRLSVGVAINIWRSTFLAENGWEQITTMKGTTFFGAVPILNYGRMKERYSDFKGLNATIGVLWTPTDRWSIGLRYDSEFEASAQYSARGMSPGWQLNLPPSFYFSGPTPVIKHEKRHVRFPASFALGVAHRFNDKLTLSMDATRTDWSNFTVKDGEGVTHSLVDYHDTHNRFVRTRFRPTYTVRLGVEHIFLPKEPPPNLKTLWTVRGGVFFDQEPATHKSSRFQFIDDRGDGRPDNFYGAAAGVGLQLVRRVNLDLAYQFRWGPGVNSDFIRGIDGFKEDVYQHRVLLSTVVYF